MLFRSRKHERSERAFLRALVCDVIQFEMTTRACVSEVHWCQWRFRNWTPLVVDISLRFIARDLRVDFLKIALFRKQFVRGQKTIGSHLNMRNGGWFLSKKDLAFKGQATRHTTIKLSI